jgi:hypothetical protein
VAPSPMSRPSTTVATAMTGATARSTAGVSTPSPCEPRARPASRTANVGTGLRPVQGWMVRPAELGLAAAGRVDRVCPQLHQVVHHAFSSASTRCAAPASRPRRLAGRRWFGEARSTPRSCRLRADCGDSDRQDEARGAAAPLPPRAGPPTCSAPGRSRTPAAAGPLPLAPRSHRQRGWLHAGAGRADPRRCQLELFEWPHCSRVAIDCSRPRR